MRFLLIFWFLSISLINRSESVFTDYEKIYNETEARELFEMLASVHSKYPDGCLKAGFHNPKTRPKLIKRMEFACDILNSKCTFGVFELVHLKQLVIAVRGTQSMTQFFFEFMSFFIPDTSFHGLGEINFYFSKTFEVVFEEMRKFLTDEQFVNHDVIFTGHSLGGSLAALIFSVLTFTSNENQMIISQFSVRCDFFGNPCAGYIVVSEVLQQITVVFRGTKTNSQLLLEGWTTLKPSADFYGIGLVNTYFKSGHEKTWDYVAAVLNNTNYQNYDVYVTGHSLGGALAALAAPRIVHEGLRQSHQVKIITFGEPRVGNLDFSHGYDQLVPYSFRVTHAIDVVPHLPACVKDLSYTPPEGSDGSMPCDPVSTNGGYHHAIEVWYPGNMTQGSQYMICTGLPRDEDFSCSNAPKVNLDDTTMGVWDHRNYFGVEVPAFGKGGCDPSLTFSGPPTKTGIAALVSSVFGRKR